MTTNDPGATPPNASPGHIPLPPPPPRPQEISAGALIGGLALSLFVGAIANIFAGLVGMSTGNQVAAFAVGAVPGALFIVASRAARANGFAQGLLIGGCIVALIGGACGASMAGASFG